jgi:transcriptional repressor NrdR
MECPYCTNSRNKVIDSRSAEGGKAIRRRRQCLNCSKRFTTYEHVEQTARLVVVKRDQTRVPFDREKFVRGIEKACYKRPVTPEQMQQAAADVEDQLFTDFDREVSSVDIGLTVAERLKRLDHIAYVRFAAVFKDFRSLDDFLNEVREVLANTDINLPGQGMLFD